VNRPLHVWLLFSLCAALMLATLGWLTANTLRLDEAQRRSTEEAEVEGRVRLALWRMDSALALLLAQENARPWSDYDAFHPAERAFTKKQTAFPPGEVLVPSPLLGSAISNVLLHFQFGPEGRFTSPEIPAAIHGSLAEAPPLAANSPNGAATRLPQLERLMAESGQVPPAATSSGMDPVLARRYGLASSSAKHLVSNRERATEAANAQLAQDASPLIETNLAEPRPQDLANQSYLNSSEQRARANVVQGQNSQLASRYGLDAQAVTNRTQPRTATQASRTPVTQPRAIGSFAANWLGGELVLTRRVEFADTWRIQGCWLDWPALRTSLLASVRDLLPAARLQPVTDSARPPDGRRLVALPLRLETGMLAAPPSASWSPLRLTLVLAWAGAFVAALAVALLLHGTLALSERRAAFVSAVTHELRTPLTTFQMYSEMLAEGMVTDPAQRQNYLATLRAEAGRLGHLVENVLAYARLERGSARGRVETLPVHELLLRTRERLAPRAEQAGLTLTVEAGAAAEILVRTDVSAVEQILFNLVDNAGKYAAPTASDPTLHLEVLPPERKSIRLRVRDHGPGIEAEVAARLFQPFSKSAQEAAHSAPGVGLGLALCRRLARSLGGDLVHNTSVTPGAAFILKLPRA
jgi:signal transduction histidine kinase